jgi:hypothetical protein
MMPAVALVLAVCLGIVTDAGAAQPVAPDLADLARRSELRTEGREVTYLEDGAYRGARVSPARGFGVIWLDGTAFSVGTIEVDVRGRDVQSQSFLGLAIGSEGEAYESVFLRPFNFRTTDPVRRMHAVQYESMPDHNWSRLRTEFPEVYENPVDPPPDPNGWVRLTLLVEPARIRVFVTGGVDPDLMIDRIPPARTGRLGLWVGTLSGGDFANLRILPNELRSPGP